MRDRNPFEAIASDRKAAPPACPRRVTQATAAARRLGSQVAAACRKQTPVVLEKFLFFGGLASAVFGCWMIYRPLGPLVGGVLAVWLGMLISVERNEPRP